MRTIPILLICFMISACSPRLVSLPEPTQANPTVDAITSFRTPDLKMDGMAARAIEDLSIRLSIDSQLVQILSAESALWPNTALGCPPTGELYIQKTVPGYQLVLEANDREYIYHTDTTSTVILCSEEDLPSFPVTPGEIDDGQPWMPVD